MTTDPLTGVLNRRGFEARAQAELRRAAHTGRPLSLAMLDLDDFKSVNDSAGHQAGDDMLKRLAAQWISLSRDGDALGRTGVDEFIFVLPDTDIEDATMLMDRLGASAIHPWSYGLVQIEPGERLADATHRADMAMYARKRARRKVSR